jgi:AcrR family transcriptional regulator
MVTLSDTKQTRSRVPAAERRDALIEAAVHEFAQGGLHGTPVDRIARRVGVAQPYVFSLFGSKKQLFLAAVERGVEFIGEPDADVLHAMGASYIELLHTHPDHLMIQHQMYAACDDAEIRDRVRALYARLVRRVQRLATDAAERHGLLTPTAEQIDEFFRYGMWLNVAAAMGVEDLSAGCEWVRAETNK